MAKEKKEIEYPDAPSGFVTLYNYKEPFMEFKTTHGEGYGYQGVLLFDGVSDQVQCHFCGKWFSQLGNHLHKEHNMTAADYKDKVGLRQTTALIGDKLREKMISGGQQRFKNLKPGQKKTLEQKQKIRNTMQNVMRQSQNERGTCPLQLIDRLQRMIKDNGGIVPSSKKVNFEPTLARVFGSYNKAVQAAGFTPRKPGQTTRITKFNYNYFLDIFKKFYAKEKRSMRFKDFERENVWNKYKPFQTQIETEVILGLEQYHNLPRRIRYTNEMLIQIIRNFKKVNGRDPSYSDCKRGLLPHASNYYYHFGGLKEAIAQSNA